MNHHQTNRHALMKKLGKSLVIVPAYRRMQQTNNGAAPFVQESNFLYLTGIEEPNWWLVLDGKTGQEYLLAPKENPAWLRAFHGESSHAEVVRSSGIEALLTKPQLREIIANYSDDVYTIFPQKSDYFHPNPAYAEVVRFVKRAGKTPHDCGRELARLRAIKQDYEIEALRKAFSITIDAYRDIHKRLAELPSESMVEAAFTTAFRHSGARHAYDPIVAGGARGCTVHYQQNNEKLNQGEFVLLDVAAKWRGYSADLTRTYAVGDVSNRHKEVHRTVQTAQQEIIGLLKPGLRVRDYAEQADEIMKRHMIALGLFTDMSDQEAYRRHMPHAISHGLGLDVHDSLGGPDAFQPGMVLMVEPGIYIPEEEIGVRLEDAILITHDGHENISGALSTDW